MGIAAIAAAIATWALPWYVQRRSVEIAAEHGIALSVERAEIDRDGFRLVGIRASWNSVPGIHARAPEIRVETRALHPEKMTVQGAELTLDGTFAAITSQLTRWWASPSGGQAGAWAPSALVVDGAKIAWPSSFGDTVGVEASNVHAEVSWGEHGAELHSRADRVTVALPEAAFGPWRVDVDRAPGSSRVRVALDPEVPEACTILVVGDGERTTSVDIAIPRSPLGHLGVPERLVGGGSTTLQVETTLHYVSFGAARVDATVRGGVYGLGAAGLPVPLDVAWEGAASGDPTRGIDIKRSRLAVGPLVGPLTGTVKTFDDGFRVDLGWAAGPVPCAAFVQPLGAGQPFDIGYQLRELARKSGVVDGNIRATMTLSFDSRNVAATKVSFNPEVRCRSPIFQ